MPSKNIFEFRLDAKSVELLKRLQEMTKPGVVEQYLLRFMDREGQLLAAQVVKTRLSGPASGGNGLRRRTGSLARSIMGRGEMVNGVPGIRFGSLRGPALKYVALQEYGGTIVPKSAKNLAVPVNDALTPAGVPRKPGPRDWGRLRFIPFRRGGNVVGALYTEREYAKIRAAIRSKSFNSLRSYRALYLLLKRVRIEPKAFLRKGLEAYLPELRQNLTKFITALFNATGGRA